MTQDKDTPFKNVAQVNNIQQRSSFPIIKLAVASVALAGLLASSGCATNELLESNNRVSTKTVKSILSEDQIIAFGRPATTLPDMPMASMVIVGEKNNYVLTQGGKEMVNLLTNLSAKNIQVENDMAFNVPNNDGYFQGQMKMSYVKLKDEFSRGDYQFFLQNGGQECSSASDQRMDAQRFCFTVPVKGGIYPRASNLSMIQSKYKPLSKPYTVTFYSSQTQQAQTISSGANTGQKLVLLPFALAFDVITLPFQLLGAVID